MKQLANYFIYTLLNVIRTKVFIICISIYYIAMAFFYFFVPLVLKQTLMETFNFRVLITTINFILVILAVCIVGTLFKRNLDDGSELIIISKPISRTAIGWIKIFTILFINLMISVGLTIIASFLAINNKGSEVKGIILGAFVGSLINLMFWSGLSIIGCLILNYAALFLTIFAVAGIAAIASNVIELTSNPTLLEVNLSGVNTANIDFVDTKKNELSTYTIALVDNESVNETTVIKDKTLSELGYDSQTILNSVWSKTVRNANLILKSYVDPAGLLASFYNISIQNWSIPNYGYVTPNYLLNTNNYYPKFTSINDKASHLNEYASIELDGQKLYLVALNLDFNKLNQTFIDNVILPTPIYNNETKNFNEIKVNRDNLLTFANTYFNNKQIERFKKAQDYIDTVTVSENEINVYYSLLTSYLVNKTNIGINDGDQYHNLANDKIVAFQYYTFLFLQDYLNDSSKYNELNVTEEQILTTTIQLLRQTYNSSLEMEKLGTKGESLIMLEASKYNSFLDNPSNETLNVNLIGNLSGWFDIPMTLTNIENLNSLSLTELVPTYNFKITIPVLFAICFILNILGASILMRHDLR